MFIYNVKVNGSKSFKIIFTFLIIVILLITAVCVFRIFSGADSSFTIDDNISSSNIFEIQPQNYTNVLKSVHENIDKYVGMNIRFTGFVYKIDSLSDNQFILARNMIVSSDFKSVIVGFLCECDNISQYPVASWVSIEGEITKGEFYGEMPIVKINKIESTQKPNEENVYPPSDEYVETTTSL